MIEQPHSPPSGLPRVDIATIVLTKNEEIHIRRCIENVRTWVRDVFVVDCFSTDQTKHEVMAFSGAKVFGTASHENERPDSDSGGIVFVQHAWPGAQSKQFNWALNNLPIQTEWVLRLDADEYLCPDLIDEIKVKLAALPPDVTGVEFHLRRIFLGRIMRRGMPRIKMLRLFRFGKACCEQRLMDEHIYLLEGRSVVFDGEFADDNLNDLSWWTQKHVGYAVREAADLLDLEFRLLPSDDCDHSVDANKRVKEEAMDGAGRVPPVLCGQAAEKRAKKRRYARAPLFWRAFAYFGYRYFLRGGFLEGKEGFLWHFLQGWWYRTLVDAKVWEIKRECGGDREKMLEVLRGKYGLKI